MSYDQLDRDVARYVLAYLAREGYSHTMSAFLQECSCLPASTATMVLPETPLSTIIAEHKTRKESGKLGPRASWDALWEKLQHYLTQLRTLSSTLLESHHDQPYKNKSTGRRREYRTKTRQSSRPPTVPSPSPLLHTTPSNVPICHTQVAGPSSSAVISAPEPTPSSSPRKKREPSRLQPHSDTLVALSSTSSSSSSTAVGVPAPQQLLDILLEDESLQHHLAHLINSSLVSEGGAELTDDALDNILAMTSQDMLPVTTILSGGTEDNNSSLNDDGGPQLKKHCSSRPDMELVSSSDNQQTPNFNLSTSFKDS